MKISRIIFEKKYQSELAPAKNFLSHNPIQVSSYKVNIIILDPIPHGYR